MNRWVRWIISGLQVALLMAMCVYFIGFAPRGASRSEVENRELTEAPALTWATLMNGEFEAQLESYLADHFIARDALITFRDWVLRQMSLASYDDTIGVLKDKEDNLTSTISEDALDDLLADLLGDDFDFDFDVEEIEEEPPKKARKGRRAVDDDVETPIPVVEKRPKARESDFKEYMGIYFCSNDRQHYTTYSSYGRRYVMAFTSAMNQYARLLPDGGRLMLTVASTSNKASAFIRDPDSGYVYSTCEPCVNAFGDPNVFAISAMDILNDAIKAREYVYFRTDMHWTPYGTYLVYRDMVRQAGLLPYELSDYHRDVVENFMGTYYRDHPNSYTRNDADTLELYTPSCPYEFRRVTGVDTYQVIDLIDYDADPTDRYTMYLGGSAGWAYVHCDNDSTENCLVIADSFGLAFVPLVAMNYADTHYYDPRYFDAKTTGMRVSEMITHYNITDIYVVIGDSHAFSNDFIMITARNQF